MIVLTRLDNSKLLVNLETVKYFESTPDTLMLFLNGDSLLVKEPLAEVERLALESRARVIRMAKAEENAETGA